MNDLMKPVRPKIGTFLAFFLVRYLLLFIGRGYEIRRLKHKKMVKKRISIYRRNFCYPIL